MSDDEPDAEVTHGLETMPDDEAWSLLRGRQLGRLAVCVSGLPEIFPVNYRTDGSTIVIRTAPGLKLAAAVLGQGVAFEVEEVDEVAHLGWSVVVHGQAHEVHGTESLMAAGDLEIEPWAHSAKHRFLRISVDRISGRRIA